MKTDKARDVLEKYFGKDYLRDVHTGKSMDMSGEIDLALASLYELVMEKKKVVECDGYPYCPCGETKLYNQAVQDIADLFKTGKE